MDVKGKKMKNQPRMTYTRLLIIAGVILLSATVNAQTRVVRGTVTNEFGETLPGVNVIEKGTTNGEITDMDGKYSIELQADGGSLIFSFLGYERVEAETGEKLLLDIVMKEQAIVLDDIVITGQGLGQSKKRITTKASVLGEQDIERIKAGRIDQLLQSEIPNMQIILTGGQPGSSSNTRTRGVSSGFTNTTPVIYVDGVRMDNLNGPSALAAISGSSNSANSSIANIPMENIKRIEYVNGGAATTLYGADAANGVIQIFTKTGIPNKTQAFAKVESGFEMATDDFYHFEATSDLIHQTGFVQKYTTGVNGGGSKVTFSFTGGMENRTGTRIHNQNESKDYFLSTGVKAFLSDALRYTATINFNNTQYSRVRNGNLGGYTGLWALEGGAIALSGFNNRLDELTETEYQEISDYVSEAERLQNRSAFNTRIQTSHTFYYSPTEDFNVKVLLGIDNHTQKETNIVSNEYLRATMSSAESSITNTKRSYMGLTMEGIAGYNFELGQISFSNQLGFQGFRKDEEQILYQGTNISDGATSLENAATTSSDQRIIELANYGIFFNSNISYSEKYTLDFGIRGDKSETFGDQIGMQFYPRVGLAYVVSEESFLAENALIDTWKFRANYGEAGNLPPAFAHERTIEFNGYDGDIAVGFGQPGNTELKPERIKSFEIGTEIALFASRLTAGIDYYNSKTVDALMFAPQVPSSGSSLYSIQNAGVIRNKGFEFSLKGDILRSVNLRLSAFATLNTLNNTVEELNGLPPFSINGFSERTIQVVVMEGESAGVLRGNKATWENGTVSGYQPLSVLGKTVPDIFGSFGLNLEIKQLSFRVNADYQSGASAHSFDQQFRFLYEASEQGIPQSEIDANGRSNWLNMTDQFVQKTDFLKVRIIAANYIIPLKNASFRQIELGASVLNPFNFASSDFDPEISQAGANLGQGSLSTGGIAYAIESSPRQFLFSVNLKF